MSKTPKWTSVAFPSEMVEAIRELIEELRYWPSVSTFCREAGAEGGGLLAEVGNCLTELSSELYLLTYINMSYVQLVGGDDRSEEKPRCIIRGGESCLAPGRGSKVPTAREGGRRVEPFRA